MSASVQKVIIIGNLGADPKLRYTQNSKAVANLNVATTETWKDKQTGEQRQETEWHRLVCYQRLAEIAGEYLRKGSKVYIEGKLKTRKWQGQDGKDNWTTEIIVTDLQMLDARQSGQPQGINKGGQNQGNQGGFGGQAQGNVGQNGNGFGSQATGGKSQPGFGGHQGGFGGHHGGQNI